jgi:hypothetical protein
VRIGSKHLVGELFSMHYFVKQNDYVIVVYSSNRVMG